MTNQLITYRLPIDYSLISLMSLMSSISYAWLMFLTICEMIASLERFSVYQVFQTWQQLPESFLFENVFFYFISVSSKLHIYERRNHLLRSTVVRSFRANNPTS